MVDCLSEIWLPNDLSMMLTLLAFRDVLIEYYHSIGTDGGLEEQTKLRNKVKELLVGMGLRLEELAEEEPQAAAATAEVAGGAVQPPRAPTGGPRSYPRTDCDQSSGGQ